MNNEIKEIFELYEKQANNLNLSILIKTLKEWYFEKENYKSRINKVTEYIKNLCTDYDGTIIHYGDGLNPNFIVNILEGEDNNER